MSLMLFGQNTTEPMGKASDTSSNTGPRQDTAATVTARHTDRDHHTHATPSTPTPKTSSTPSEGSEPELSRLMENLTTGLFKFSTSYVKLHVTDNRWLRSWLLGSVTNPSVPSVIALNILFEITNPVPIKLHMKYLGTDFSQRHANRISQLRIVMNDS